ncbi:hypothetical protein [Brevibacillus centrosporus]|uniref:hypothetical protein n=1 Tax=Brevibacillus centrosporus TaxID=54910 RepID=UPI003B020001
MKSASPRVKRTVEQTIEYFGLTAYSISAQKTHVTLQNKEVDSSRSSVPTTIYLSFSDKDDRLTQLTTAWSKSPKDQPPNLEAARSTAADFVELVLAEKFASAERGTLWSSSRMAIFPVYPVVNEIPVQKSVGEIFVDSNGHVSSYQLRDADFKGNTLPSKAGILSWKQAIPPFASQLQLELTYDDEHGRYAYTALPYSAIDAKTGKALEASPDFRNCPDLRPLFGCDTRRPFIRGSQAELGESSVRRAGIRISKRSGPGKGLACFGLRPFLFSS